MLRTDIDGVIEYTPRRFGDERGYFTESYNRLTYEALGVTAAFVQDNESLSATTGTIRGLHFQIAPTPQAKLIRCPQGSLLDVAVDIRPGSPTFGDHVAVTLDGKTGNQVFIPAGFAHGFCTLEPDTMIAYKVDGYYDPSADRAILWSDPALEIDWPTTDASAISAKDAGAPTLAEFGPTTGLF